MEKTFMTSVQREGLIENTSEEHEEEKETPSVPSADEKTQEDETASPAEQVEKGNSDESKKGDPAVFNAFHKHPRWIAMMGELEELRKFREQASPLLEQFGKTKQNETTDKIPDWFVDAFGENQEVWQKFKTYSLDERKQLREEILNEIRSEESRKSEETSKWNKWVDSEVNAIVGDEEVAAQVKEYGFDFSNKEQAASFRNELLKTALEYKPTGDDGNIDLRKTLNILLALKKKAPEKNSDAKKKVADLAMQKGKSDTERKGFKTFGDFSGRSFRDINSD